MSADSANGAGSGFAMGTVQGAAQGTLAGGVFSSQGSGGLGAGAGLSIGGAAGHPELGGSAGAAVTAGAAGPFNPGVNAMLSHCFGHMLDGITVARGQGKENRGIAAEAHTIDRKISLGDNITENPHDGRSMEIIAHEVSHALARGGSGKHILNKKDDPGEAVAYDAGRQFRGFVESGARGPAPQLKPAVGGQASIHRYEAGEHADAVNNAADLLKKENGEGSVDGRTEKSMKELVQLKNGLWVTPGDITAMMGDFYGAFDKQGHFDPAQAFKALNEADPKEMAAILKTVHKEEKNVQDALAKKKDENGNDIEFKATDPGELENLTKYRTLKTQTVTEPELDPKTHKPVIDPATGKEKVVTKEVTSGYSMLELADRNRSHFSTKDESGTDNNMGAYASLHEMALKAARDGDPNLAKAYEASAMHFLTDRFAGGHQFDKDAVANAAKETKGGVDIAATGVVRLMHNDYNKNGVQVSNGKEKWDALGDEHWADDKNADNRRHTAQAVYASYNELQDVIDKKKTPEDATKNGYAARKEVPEFSDVTQKKIEDEARNTSWSRLATEVGPEALGSAKPFIQRKIVNIFGPAGVLFVKAQDTESWIEKTAAEGLLKVGTGLGKAGSWLNNTIAEAGQGIKRMGGEAWDFAKHTAGEAVDGVKNAGGKALNWAEKTAGQAWDGVKNTGGKAVDFAKDTVSEAYSGTKSALGGAWSWLKDTGGGLIDHVVHDPGSTLGYLKDQAGQAWDGVSSTAGKAVDWAADKAGKAGTGIKNVAGKAVDWAEDKAGQAWDGVSSTANKAYDWAAGKASQAGTGIKNAAGKAVNWAENKAGEAWDGVSNAASSGAKWLGNKGLDAWDGIKMSAHQLGGSIRDSVNDKVETAKEIGHTVAEKTEHVIDGAGSLLHSGWNFLRKKTGL